MSQTERAGTAAEGLTGDPVQIAQELGARIAEGAAERDADRIYPDDEVRAVKESGLNALFVPRDYGGFDADYRTAMQVFAVLAEADPNLAQISQAHHCGVELLKFVNAKDLMDKYFPQIVARGFLMPSAYVDRAKDRPIDDFRARLRKDGDGYRLSGAKFYVTGSRWGDVFYTPALLDSDAEGEPEGVLAWCEADAPGVTVEDDWDAMGQRTTASGSVVFDDAPVAAESVMSADMDTDVAHNYLGAHAQIMFCGMYLGTARAALRDTLDYVRSEARPWIHSGVSSATEDPYVLHRIGEMDISVEAAAAILDRAADALDTCRMTGDPADRAAASAAVARAKAVTTEAALKTTNELFQVCGTRSTRARWRFDRHWRNMRTLTLHDPVDYKYRLVGDYVLNQTPPPISGWS